MITGAHVLLYSEKPEADRAFCHDVLGFRSVDAGGGWLIFALPPAEVAFHPVDEDTRQQVHAGHSLLGSVLYLMCDDLDATLKSLQKRNVKYTEIEEEQWGIKTTIILPSGGEIGLYQPKHASPLDLQTD
jgi:hypothetical protein